jgi:flagellar assembly protein FliH
MSSRVIRPGDRAEAQAVAWSPGGSPQQLSPAAPRRDLETDVEIEARLKIAYQHGFAAGQAAGIQQASERIEPAAAALNRIAAELATVRKRFRAEVEEDTVKLALAIARRVLHRELETDPEAILGLVMAAFQKLNARETHRLRLSPKDAAIVQEHRAQFEFPEALQINADPSLAPSSAVFETSRGELDASVEIQLAEIGRGFADVVKRRAR